MICNVFAPARADVFLILFRIAAAIAAGWLRAALALLRPAHASVESAVLVGLGRCLSVATPEADFASGDNTSGYRLPSMSPAVGTSR